MSFSTSEKYLQMSGFAAGMRDIQNYARIRFFSTDRQRELSKLRSNLSSTPYGPKKKTQMKMIDQRITYHQMKKLRKLEIGLLIRTQLSTRYKHVKNVLVAVELHQQSE